MGMSFGMKKTTTKLQLKASTLRVLQNDELAAVHGGVAQAPTNSPTNCSTSRECLLVAPAQLAY
jgi:hypothetical protein